MGFDKQKDKNAKWSRLDGGGPRLDWYTWKSLLLTYAEQRQTSTLSNMKQRLIKLYHRMVVGSQQVAIKTTNGLQKGP